eukprot:jgi/Mesvir1/21919/Mv01976-RA.1
METLCISPSVSVNHSFLSGISLERRTTPTIASYRTAKLQTRAFFKFGGGKNKAVTDAKAKLKESIAGLNRGVGAGKEDVAAVRAAADALAEFGREQTTTDGSLSATWKLLFTTEKETLFIIEKASLFGTQTGDIFQVIDVSNDELINVITFPPAGAFIVNATIDAASPQRCNFKFDSVILKTDKLRWKLPPFGQGWFESVYMDSDLRIAKDSRGDMLICERSKVPWAKEPE